MQTPAILPAMEAVAPPGNCHLRFIGKQQHQPSASGKPTDPLKQSAPFGNRQTIMSEHDPRPQRQPFDRLDQRGF